MIPWWFGLVLAGLAALVFLWPDPDLYDRSREEPDEDPERDRDPEVERRWFGVESWGGDENG